MSMSKLTASPSQVRLANTVNHPFWKLGLLTVFVEQNGKSELCKKIHEGLSCPA